MNLLNERQFVTLKDSYVLEVSGRTLPRALALGEGIAEVFAALFGELFQARDNFGVFEERLFFSAMSTLKS